VQSQQGSRFWHWQSPSAVSWPDDVISLPEVITSRDELEALIEKRAEKLTPARFEVSCL
jgi:hypothetical protein